MVEGVWSEEAYLLAGQVSNDDHHEDPGWVEDLP